MTHARGHSQTFQAGAKALLLAGLVMLGGCDRHKESDLRVMAEAWFDLGETLYFQSERNCSAAVFEARSDMIKASLRIENDVAHGVARSGADGPLALRVAGQTADGVADAIMKADKPLGVEVLVASTQGKFCMSQPARNTFFKALAEPHTVLVYDRPQKVLAILVPTQGVVLIASGEG